MLFISNVKWQHNLLSCPNLPHFHQYKSRNNYLVHINGFRGFYRQWLKYTPARSAEEELAEQQTERAAPRRVKSREKSSAPVTTLNKSVTALA